MLWTVISQADVFYQAAQAAGRPAPVTLLTT